MIVPVKDDQPGVDALLSSLEMQTYPLDLMEVIVVDNHSSHPIELPDTRLPNIRLLFEAQPSSYAARNTGIRASHGEIIVFTDADCLPESQWIERMVEAVLSSSCDAVAGSIELFVSSQPTVTEKYEQLFAFPQEHYVRQLHFGVTANLCVKRAVFDSVGLFSEVLQSGGDNEWGNRLYRNGGSLCFEKRAVVRHPARKSWREIKRKLRRTVQGYCSLRCSGKITGAVLWREYIADLVPLQQTRAILASHCSRGDKLRLFFYACLVKQYRVFEKVRYILHR